VLSLLPQAPEYNEEDIYHWLLTDNGKAAYSIDNEDAMYARVDALFADVAHSNPGPAELGQTTTHAEDDSRYEGDSDESEADDGEIIDNNEAEEAAEEEADVEEATKDVEEVAEASMENTEE